LVKIKKGKGSKREKIGDRGEIVESRPDRELWEPFKDLLSFRESIDELFRHFLEYKPWMGPGQIGSDVWKPEVDIHETKTNILVSTALPGMDAEDIEIEVTEDSVSIKGERKQDKEIKDEDYYLREQSYGSFSRSFTLPKEINVNEVEASFEKGVLKIRLPKKRSSKAKSVKIRPS